MKTINIAKDFSPHPYGRTRNLTSNSGEALRDDVIKPALDTNEIIEIILDGLEGFGSSVIDETFSSLVRNGYISLSEFKRRIHFVSETDPSLIIEIMQFVEEAE